MVDMSRCRQPSDPMPPAEAFGAAAAGASGATGHLETVKRWEMVAFAVTKCDKMIQNVTKD